MNLTEFELKRQLASLKPLCKHHSSGDWDYSAATWILDGAIYRSAPSSWRATVNTAVSAFIKTTTVPSSYLKEGRFATWVRYTAPSEYSYFQIYFRWQDGNNYYIVYIICDSPTEMRYIIRRVQDGVSTDLRSGTAAFLPVNTWYHFRVTWWNDYVGLVIRVEKENGTWAKVIADAYDSLNLWAATGGRLGFATSFYAANQWVNVDDTEIYGIPP